MNFETSTPDFWIQSHRPEISQRNTPKQTLLRIRLPDGWKVASATANSRSIKVDEQGTADISALKGKATLRVHVTK